MTIDTPPALQHLPVRRCTVLHGSGDATVDLTVYCPSRQRTVDMGTCADCSHVETLPRPHALSPAVACRPPEAAPTVSDARDATLAAARRVQVREVMSMAVICVRADTRAETVGALLVAHRIRSVPVVDDERRLLGILSKTDLLRAGAKRLATKTAGDIMTPLVHSLPDDAPLAYAIALMATDSLLEVPIVSPQAQIVGLVTANDVMRWVATELGYVIPGTEA
jgi:CBS domain-containing protein